MGEGWARRDELLSPKRGGGSRESEGRKVRQVVQSKKRGGGRGVGGGKPGEEASPPLWAHWASSNNEEGR